MRILVIEDDAPLRTLLRRGLCEDGHVVDALADGRYFFSDNCSGTIWDIAANATAAQAPQVLLASHQNATGWGQDSAGELYLVTGAGRIYRLD